MYDILQLNQKTVSDLKEIAKELDIKKYQKLKKEDLIYTILDQQALSPKKGASSEPKKETKPSQPKKEASPKPAAASENGAAKEGEKKIAYPKKPVSERKLIPQL